MRYNAIPELKGTERLNTFTFLKKGSKVLQCYSRIKGYWKGKLEEVAKAMKLRYNAIPELKGTESGPCHRPPGHRPGVTMLFPN